jgi:hypothetical protein
MEKQMERHLVCILIDGAINGSPIEIFSFDKNVIFYFESR